MARTDRDRQAEALEDLDALPDDDGGCAGGMLLQTFSSGSYPASASAVYTCHPVVVDAGDAEGDTPTFAADTSVVILAVNIGSAIPDVGAHVIASAVGGRLCFSWDTAPP